MTKPELIKLLQTTQNETSKYFDLEDAELEKTYCENKWNVRQILHHLTDTELLFQGRLKRIIAEPRQVIWAFNQDQWNEAFNYKIEPLKNKKQVYEICRGLNIELIDTYYDKFINKEFVHSETGLRTLKDEFEKVALHNQGHNLQLQQAIEK